MNAHFCNFSFTFLRRKYWTRKKDCQNFYLLLSVLFAYWIRLTSNACRKTYLIRKYFWNRFHCGRFYVPYLAALDYFEYLPWHKNGDAIKSFRAASPTLLNGTDRKTGTRGLLFLVSTFETSLVLLVRVLRVPAVSHRWSDGRPIHSINSYVLEGFCFRQLVYLFFIYIK